MRAAALELPFDVKSAYGGAFADASRFNQHVKLLWMGAGTAHEWRTWRRDLNDLAPRLFR